MRCRIVDLRNKEIINVCDGCRLGFPCDVEFEADTGRIFAIVVPGPPKHFGLFGKLADIVIPWDAIRRVGDDIILVDYAIKA